MIARIGIVVINFLLWSVPLLAMQESSNQNQSEEENLHRLNEFLLARVHLSVNQIMNRPHFNANAAILPNGATLLQCAAGNNVLSLARNLIEEHGAEVDICTAKGYTPLFCAASGGYCAMAGYLLSKKASVHVRDSLKRTTLHWAVLKDNPEMVRLLLNFHADVNAIARDGSTPLCLAAYNGFFECARLLLDADALIHKPDDNKSTPLHLASAQGHSAIVELLLQYNADKIALDGTSQIPLMLATNMRIRKLLAHPVIRDGSCFLNRLPEPAIIPLSKAAHNGDSSALRALCLSLSDNQSTYPLHIAVAADQIESVKNLVRNGASLAIVDQFNNTPLHTALSKNHVEIAGYIIDTIVNKNKIELLNKKNVYNQTPLMIAAQICLPTTEPIITRLLNLGVDQTGYEAALPEFMKLIIKAASKASPAAVREAVPPESAPVTMRDRARHAPDNNNKIDDLADNDASAFGTVLHSAAGRGRFATVRLLLDRGAPVNEQDNNNETPLHLASKQGHSAIVELLLQYNADKSIANRSGNTALQVAANMRIRKLLSDRAFNTLLPVPEVLACSIGALHGKIAQFSKQNNSHNTCLSPLHSAIKADQIEALKILLDHNCSLNTIDHEGNTPLHAALIQNHIEAAEIIIDTIIKKNKKELLNTKNNAQQTLLMIAASISLPSTMPIIDRLLDLGVDRTGYSESLPDFMRNIIET